MSGDPNSPTFSVPNIGLSDQAEISRLNNRVSLRQKLDTLERALTGKVNWGRLTGSKSKP